MYSVTVTIGRNVTRPEPASPNSVLTYAEPMPDEQWTQFKADVIATVDDPALRRNQDATIETASGIGVWHGESEPNFKVTSLTNHTWDEDALNILRRSLSELARHYDQDAIALTIGTSELV